jgi:hypothetical protein
MAVSLAQMAKQKMPQSPATSDTLGWAYYKLGSPEAAIGQLKESVEKAPHVAVYHYHLGLAYGLRNTLTWPPTLSSGHSRLTLASRMLPARRLPLTSYRNVPIPLPGRDANGPTHLAASEHGKAATCD